MKAFLKKAWAYIVLAVMLIGFAIWYLKSGNQIHEQAVKAVADNRKRNVEDIKAMAEADARLRNEIRLKEEVIAQDRQDEVLARFHQKFGRPS